MMSRMPPNPRSLLAPAPLSGDERGEVLAAFTGSVFNAARLRESLIERGHTLDGESDCELVAGLYAEFGPELVHALDGAFALAVWDKAREEVFIARDRFGEVPCRYAERDGVVEFGGDATTELPAGHRLRWRGEGGAEAERYWALPTRSDPGGESKDELAAELERLLAKSVRARIEPGQPVMIRAAAGPAAPLLATLAAREGGGAVSWAQGPGGAAGTLLDDCGARELFGSGGEVEPPGDARCPFLQFEVAEFAVTVPPDLRGTGRGSLLRFLLEKLEVER